jgi:hypothetical protein
MIITLSPADGGIEGPQNSAYFLLWQFTFRAS